MVNLQLQKILQSMSPIAHSSLLSWIPECKRFLNQLTTKTIKKCTIQKDQLYYEIIILSEATTNGEEFER